MPIRNDVHAHSRPIPRKTRFPTLSRLRKFHNLLKCNVTDVKTYSGFQIMSDPENKLIPDLNQSKINSGPEQKDPELVQRQKFTIRQALPCKKKNNFRKKLKKIFFDKK